MKIIIDDKIPYIKGALEPFAEVVYLPGGKTTPKDVRDADALITRTRTVCNEALLSGSSVRFIATATIGFDHIDTVYCAKAGIAWTNAPGCNAGSVGQYIAAALFHWAHANRVALGGKNLGIIGAGNVGSTVEKFCRIVGMNILLNDPPRERSEGSGIFVSLETIKKEADIITLHVPLTMEGEDATFRMIDSSFLRGLEKKCLLINSCRGEVTDSFAVAAFLKTGALNGYIADCWDNEPNIDPGFLGLCHLGTPHIAGYSKDGKANGTKMSVQALSRFFNLGMDDWQPQNIELPRKPYIELEGKGKNGEEIIAKAVKETYDIKADDRALRHAPNLFEKLRGDYPVRREFGTYTVKANHVSSETLDKLQKAGFNIHY